MSTYDKYLGSEMGRTFLISSILVLIFGYIAIIIPLAPYDQNAWYAFLYEDVTLDDEDRFNVILVILESLLLTLFYLFLTISLGSYAEINNRLPSWGEIFIAVIITLVFAYLLPQISVGDVDLVDGSGFKHFTPDMQIWTFVGTLVGITLMTLYMFYTQEPEE